jgi:hypothetical protein
MLIRITESRTPKSNSKSSISPSKKKNHKKHKFSHTKTNTTPNPLPISYNPKKKHLNQKSRQKKSTDSVPECQSGKLDQRNLTKHKVVTCKNCVAVSAVWPTAISKKDETMLCLSVAESTPSITLELCLGFQILTPSNAENIT